LIHIASIFRVEEKAEQETSVKAGGKLSREEYSLDYFAICFHAGFLLGLFFDPEEGGDMFLRNVGGFSTEYTALYHRREYSSLPQL
jgi:hypothetical protein